MKKLCQIVLATALSISLGTAVFAQDIYIKNKLYKGPSSGSGSSMMVGVESFLKALKVSDFEIKDGKLMISGETADVQAGDTESMIALDKLSDLLGLKVIANKDLGTIDVYKGKGKMANSAGRGSKANKSLPTVVKASQTFPGAAVTLEDSMVYGRQNIVYFYADW